MDQGHIHNTIGLNNDDKFIKISALAELECCSRENAAGTNKGNERTYDA